MSAPLRRITVARGGTTSEVKDDLTTEDIKAHKGKLKSQEQFDV
jgi:hypothetical protein